MTTSTAPTLTDLIRSRETGSVTGYGQVRKTRKSAQREADRWNASNDGARYLWSERTNVTPPLPAHYETCVAEVQTVEGGFACAYVTTVEPAENVLPR